MECLTNLREAAVERVGDVHAGIDAHVLPIPAADVEARVQVESAGGSGRSAAHLRRLVQDKYTVAETAICRYVNPLSGSNFAVASQDGRTCIIAPQLRIGVELTEWMGDDMLSKTRTVGHELFWKYIKYYPIRNRSGTRFACL